MQLNGARILLTGASGGLGGVLARELAEDIGSSGSAIDPES